ncbi:MAG: HAD family phosphatase [Saprospiraceae bacterium]|nr:HAD family phosphatase [Saprospiraceae bacterium]
MYFIFDMDGTMVDNMMVHHQAWQQILAENGMELSMDEVKEKIHGINEEIMEREFGDFFSPADRKRIAWEKEATYRRIFKDELELIVGLPQLLEEAHQANIPMAIASAAPPENVDFVLDNLHLRHYFKAVVHASMVEKGKPDPEVFEKAAAAIGVTTADCVIFEDSPTGAEAARRAGSATIILTTTHGAEEFAHMPNVKATWPDYRGATVASIRRLL